MKRMSIIVCIFLLLCISPHYVYNGYTEVEWIQTDKPSHRLSIEYSNESIGVFTNQWFDDWGEDYGISGNGSAENPYIIENKCISINGSIENDVCISIRHTDVHIIVRNCTLQGKTAWVEYEGAPYPQFNLGGIAIWLENVTNCIIQNNTIVNTDRAIDVNDSPNNIVIENRIFGGGWAYSYDSGTILWEPRGIGIIAEWGADYSLIRNNTVVDCSLGIICTHVTSNIVDANMVFGCDGGISTSESTDHTISNNTASYNIKEGISFGRTNRTIVENNTCNHNGYYGIFVDNNSHDNLFLNNTCSFNGDLLDQFLPAEDIKLSSSSQGYGLLIANGSSNNRAEWNYLAENRVNAQNDVFGNHYDYNYYSDYTGMDQNNDGIGDTPYDIGGKAPTQDLHPRGSFNSSATPTIPTTNSGSMLPVEILILGVGVIALVLVIVTIFVKKR